MTDNGLFVYLDMNIHFYLDDNCEGALALDPGEAENYDLSAENAFFLAEDLVDRSNEFLEMQSDNAPINQANFGVTVTDAQFVPVRFRIV